MNNKLFEQKEGYVLKKIGKFYDYVTMKVGKNIYLDLKRPQKRKLALRWIYGGSDVSNAEVFDTDTYLYSRLKEIPSDHWDSMEKTKKKYFTDKKQGLKHLFIVLNNIEKEVMLNSIDNNFSQKGEEYYS